MEIRFLKRQAIGWKFSMGRTYSIDEADKTVTFRTEGSTFPNSDGEVLKRVLTKLTADELIYTNPTTTLGARVEAVWKRVK
jgi:hypothetical protein